MSEVHEIMPLGRKGWALIESRSKLVTRPENRVGDSWYIWQSINYERTSEVSVSTRSQPLR